MDAAFQAQVLDLLFLRYDFLRLSLLGTVLVGVACGILGCFILLQGLSLFGDALGHAVLPGVLVGYFVGGKRFYVIFFGALAAGLVAAALIQLIPRLSRHRADTAIGVVFTGMFGLGVALLSREPAGTSGVTAFLFGRALGIGPQEVAWAAGALVLVLAFVGLSYPRLQLLCFDPVQARAVGLPTAALTAALLALTTGTVIVGLPAVGAVLVVALLVIPAATAALLADRLGPMLALAAGTGGVSAAVGLAASHLFGWASGASIVLAAAGLFTLAFAARRVGPRHG